MKSHYFFVNFFFKLKNPRTYIAWDFYQSQNFSRYLEIEFGVYLLIYLIDWGGVSPSDKKYVELPKRA